MQVADSGYSFKKDTSERSISRSLKRSGLSDKKIDSFIRGWNQVKNKGVTNAKNK